MVMDLESCNPAISYMQAFQHTSSNWAVQSRFRVISESAVELYTLGMSRASDNIKDAMKKQIQLINSVFSHVRP